MCRDVLEKCFEKLNFEKITEKYLTDYDFYFSLYSVDKDDINTKLTPNMYNESYLLETSNKNENNTCGSSKNEKCHYTSPCARELINYKGCTKKEVIEDIFPVVYNVTCLGDRICDDTGIKSCEKLKTYYNLSKQDNVVDIYFKKTIDFLKQDCESRGAKFFPFFEEGICNSRYTCYKDNVNFCPEGWNSSLSSYGICNCPNGVDSSGYYCN